MARTEKPIENKPGSLIHSEPEFLMVGKLHKPHGLKGGMTLEILSDFPERLIQGRTVYVGAGKEKLTIKAIKQSGQKWIITFKEYDQPEDLFAFRNQYLFISGSQLPSLQEGEFYHHQLIGLRVLDHNEVFLGQVTEILTTGANDVYVVKDTAHPADEMLIPAIKSVIMEVNLTDNIMIVKLPQWL